MSPINDVEIVINSFEDLFMKKNCNNYNEVRGCILASSTHHSRTPSLSSSNSEENYLMRVQRESNRIVKDDPVSSTDSPQLYYVTTKNKDDEASKVAEPSMNSRQQYVENIGPALNNNPVENDNMFNIQLNYDINQALNSESGGGNF